MFALSANVDLRTEDHRNRTSRQNKPTKKQNAP